MRERNARNCRKPPGMLQAHITSRNPPPPIRAQFALLPDNAARGNTQTIVLLALVARGAVRHPAPTR